jgi:hypothetical protein
VSSATDLASGVWMHKTVTSLFYTDLVILQVAVFSCAVAFFADAASKQSFQKICMIGLFSRLCQYVATPAC